MRRWHLTLSAVRLRLDVPKVGSPGRVKTGNDAEGHVYGCEVLFDQAGAERVRAGIKRGLGVSLCPCQVGQPCPLLPPDVQSLTAPWAAPLVQTTRPVASGE
jgi:hypothetical protein